MSRNQSSLIRSETVALLFAMLFPTAAAWFYFLAPAGTSRLPLAYSISKLIQFSFPAIWVFGIRRERPSLAAPGRGGAQGLVWGMAPAGAVVGAYALLRDGSLTVSAASRITERLDLMGTATPVRYLLLALFLSILHAFLEEYYWRWFIFGRLRRRLPDATALVLSSLGFAGHHVLVLHAFLGQERILATALFALGVAACGGIWAWLYARTASLKAPWLSHMLVDLTLMGIGYDLVFT